ncbi:MAG: elongation factor P [Elusimicrobiota bacterium]
MISTADFKNGVNIFVDGEPYQIIWFQNHKPGKGGAVMRTKLRHLKKGSIVDKTFKSGEKFDTVDTERRKKQYLYKEGEEYVFMDMETYDQVHVSKELLGEGYKYLTENLEVSAMYMEGQLAGVELPISVVVTITETEPGSRGNTVQNVMKLAKVNTGAEVQVPLFCKEGDKIRVDTRTGEYVERAV